jgi:sigma-B regulation protein RsbU (phosphoserine phosphatase)
VYGLYKPGTDQHYPTEELPLARVIRGEQVEETEIQIKNERLSEAGWASVTAGPIRDIRGGLIGGVAVFRDITSRRRAEELSLRLANAVEQTADSVMITDMEGLIQYVNPAFEHTTGYSREEAIGATPRLLRSGRQSPSYYRELWTTILDGKSFKATVVNRKRCGEHYVVEQTITPMRQNGAGDITHFVAVMRDLTDQLKAQEHGAELRLAASMQQLLFPRTPPQIPGYDIAGAFSPALATCGDYFDFLRVSDHRLAFVVADVCGHGLGPGLIMAATRGYLRSLAQTGLPLGEVVESLNRLLQDDLDGRHFVTMVVGLLDLPSGTLNWANMGHPSGFVLEASGAVRTTLRSTCKPLGLFAELGCPLGEPTVLEPGCTLVLMTDGVLETESAEGIQHGSEAALRVFRENIQRPAAEIVAAVIAATKAFSGATAQEDDITVVVVKRAAA